MASLKKTIKKTLGKTLDEIGTQFVKEIVSVLAHVSVAELRDALAGLRGEGRASKTPKRSSKRRSSAKSGHALEKLAADVVVHLREHGPLRAEGIRRALGISPEDTSRALALALEWKMLTKTGAKRATVYKATKQRGPKPRLTVGDRVKVAALGK